MKLSFQQEELKHQTVQSFVSDMARIYNLVLINIVSDLAYTIY